MRYIHPVKFIPYLKPTIWGGEKIAAFKGLDTPCTCIGESWEISGVEGRESEVAEGEEKGMTISALIAKYGEELVGKECYERYGTSFPLLVKFIDAKNDLSIQVHPDDTLAKEVHGSTGKCEMWYVLATDPGAIIYSGLSQAVTPDIYEQKVADNSILDIISKYESRPGDIFYLPAGRIHSIGAGNLLLEIQQTSDITYRIYDYNRTDSNGCPRELHTELAKRAIDFKVHPSYHSKPKTIDATESLLVKEFCFEVRRVDVRGEIKRDISCCDSFITLTCIDGETELSTDNANYTLLSKGETVLIPANASSIHFKGNAVVVAASL